MTRAPIVRLTYWLTREERVATRDAVETRLAQTRPDSPDESVLLGIVTELDVAAPRTVFNPVANKVGKAKDSMAGAPDADTRPVCLSETEREAVLSLPGLHRGVREKLG